MEKFIKSSENVSVSSSDHNRGIVDFYENSAGELIPIDEFVYELLEALSL